jgi:transposase
MLSVEGWTTIRYLHAQGKSIRAIADELGIARNTVRAALRRDGPPRYVRPKRPNPKLAPFADQIRRMAGEQGLIGSRILRELRALGYRGGPTALYSHLRALRAGLPDPRVTARFETGPGQQGQFDWSPYTIPLGGAPAKVIVFCLTLAFSRRKLFWPSCDETQGSIFEAIEAALRFFGGAPKELLLDNAKAFVADARPDRFAWNPRFLELCGHYAIEPIVCQPGRPQTKGKVERPFFYLEEQLIKGRAWPDFDAFAADLARFVADDVDVRVHSTTQERPIDRFAREQPALTPLPRAPFIGSHEESRKVSWDCLVSFRGARYSVPWVYAGQRVWARASQGRRLLLRNQGGEEVARHALAATKGVTVLVAEHYAGLRQDQPKTKAVVAEAFLRRFPEHAWFVAAVERHHPSNAVAHLRAILGLADLYAPAGLRAAFEEARAYQTYSHRFIRGLLEAGDQVAPPSGTILCFARPPGAVGADLGVYQAILEAAR